MAKRLIKFLAYCFFFETLARVFTKIQAFKPRGWARPPPNFLRWPKSPALKRLSSITFLISLFFNNSKMPRNLYCNMLGSSPNVQNLVSKIFAKYCKRLVSKVSCLVSVSERSSLGLARVFAQSLGLATSMSRLGLEDFGRDSSSGNFLFELHISACDHRLSLDFWFGEAQTINHMQRCHPKFSKKELFVGQRYRRMEDLKP